jgi:hypothetical protein
VEKKKSKMRLQEVTTEPRVISATRITSTPSRITFREDSSNYNKSALLDAYNITNRLSCKRNKIQFTANEDPETEETMVIIKLSYASNIWKRLRNMGQTNAFCNKQDVIISKKSKISGDRNVAMATVTKEVELQQTDVLTEANAIGT